MDKFWSGFGRSGGGFLTRLFSPQVIPEDIQKNLLQEIPQPRAVPKRLDEYTPEEIAAFPQIWTP